MTAASATQTTIVRASASVSQRTARSPRWSAGSKSNSIRPGHGASVGGRRGTRRGRAYRRRCSGCPPYLARPPDGCLRRQLVDQLAHRAGRRVERRPAPRRVSEISTIRSIPAAPSTTGTPTNRPSVLYSPWRRVAHGRTRLRSRRIDRPSRTWRPPARSTRSRSSAARRPRRRRCGCGRRGPRRAPASSSSVIGMPATVE